MSGAGETWLVTGAGRGIGLALAQAQLARGGRVVASHRGLAPPALDALRKQHGEALTLVSFDLRDDMIAGRLGDAWSGPIDVLVNNAGTYGPRSKSVLGQDLRSALDAVDVNALGAVRMIEAALPHLAGAPRPRVATISSLLGTPARAGAGGFAYAVSKAALNMIMHIAAHELAPRGIAAACLRPGHVPTQMNGFTGPDTPEASAAGLLRVTDGLQVRTPPPFLDFTGAELSW